MDDAVYNVQILADSVNEHGNRLTTFELTYPRFVHAEFMTHRLISRNAASSRAIPSRKLLQKALENTAYPLSWGKNRSGMQATETFDLEESQSLRDVWTEAMDDAAFHAKRLMDRGVHKQVANRLLEPFLPMTVIASATEWDNFIYLRDNDLAQPEIAWVAQQVRLELEGSVPDILTPGEWHLPLVSDDRSSEYFSKGDLRHVSAARCARVSYLNHDGKKSQRDDEALFERLVTNGHWSPLEHVAMCTGANQRWGNYFGWKQLRKFYSEEHIGRDLD